MVRISGGSEFQIAGLHNAETLSLRTVFLSVEHKWNQS